MQPSSNLRSAPSTSFSCPIDFAFCSQRRKSKTPVRTENLIRVMALEFWLSLVELSGRLGASCLERNGPCGGSPESATRYLKSGHHEKSPAETGLVFKQNGWGRASAPTPHSYHAICGQPSLSHPGPNAPQQTSSLFDHLGGNTLESVPRLAPSP